MGQSRWVIVLVVVVLSFIAPAAICVAAARVPTPSLADAALLSLSAAVWMALLVLVNWWEFTSVHLRWAWAAMLAVVLARRALEASGTPLLGSSTIVMAVAAVLAGLGLWLLAGVFRARSHDGDAIDLGLPFGPGRFLVTDGGDGARSFLVNYHYGFGQHRSSGVSRSMRYAMDVVEIGTTGGESHGFLPARNDAYRIWERRLLSPCDGVVVHAANDVADNEAFGHHRPYGVGNQVVIRTRGDVHVVLGHMRQGSITVAPGDAVTTGQVIGKVGNSGWTERPHLHCQAMRSAGGDYWHGEPVAMRFGGRFLVRNQVARVRSQTTVPGE